MSTRIDQLNILLDKHSLSSYRKLFIERGITDISRCHMLELSGEFDLFLSFMKDNNQPLAHFDVIALKQLVKEARIIEQATKDELAAHKTILAKLEKELQKENMNDKVSIVKGSSLGKKDIHDLYLTMNPPSPRRSLKILTRPSRKEGSPSLILWRQTAKRFVPIAKLSPRK